MAIGIRHNRRIRFGIRIDSRLGICLGTTIRFGYGRRLATRLSIYFGIACYLQRI